MFKRIISVLLLFSCLVLPAMSENTPKQMRKQTSDYFNTVSALFLYDAPSQTKRFEQTWAKVKDILFLVENAVSLSVPDSDIARFNALPCGGRMQVSPITAAILQVAFAVHEETGGLYDPTVYPLVDLWGFSPRFNTNSYQPTLPYDRAYVNGKLPLPDNAHVQALLPIIGLSGISFEESGGEFYLTKHTPSVTIDGVTIHAQLDLGGIAKGYACDLVDALLKEQGYTYGHFVCGDSSMAILSRPTDDGRYHLNLGKPRSGSNQNPYFAAITLANTMLSTSSDSRHAYIIDDIRYCHMIDPRTGYPVNMPENGIQKGAINVTLLADGAARSDALTTALCMMTPAQAVQFLQEKVPQADAILVYSHAQQNTFEVVTTLPPDCITLEDDAYRPASILDKQGIPTYTGTFF